MKKILVTGALGQIGSELIMKLREVYGADQVVATDIRKKKTILWYSPGHLRFWMSQTETACSSWQKHTR